MAANRPLRPHVQAHRPIPRVAAARIANASSRSRKTWHREKRRGVIAAVAVALVLGGSLSVFVVHSQLTQAAARERSLVLHTAALATSASLGSGSVLFVPEYGNNCRRRWLDNKTGKLRDGGEVHCDEAVGWNAAPPTRTQNVERRMDAIRNGFQSRTGDTSD